MKHIKYLLCLLLPWLTACSSLFLSACFSYNVNQKSLLKDVLDPTLGYSEPLGALFVYSDNLGQYDTYQNKIAKVDLGGNITRLGEAEGESISVEQWRKYQTVQPSSEYLYEDIRYTQTPYEFSAGWHTALYERTSLPISKVVGRLTLPPGRYTTTVLSSDEYYVTKHQKWLQEAKAMQKRQAKGELSDLDKSTLSKIRRNDQLLARQFSWKYNELTDAELTERQVKSAPQVH